MNKIFWILLIMPTWAAAADSHWEIFRSTLTYAITHPLHHVEATSNQARGKGDCTDKGCEFLIGTPVKSFDSGDTNRDLHMQQVTRAADHPLVTVHTTIPALGIESKEIDADLDVDFAGEKHTYKHVPIHITGWTETTFRATTSLPLKLSDFKIERPSFLTVAINDDAPINVDITWQKH